MKRTFLLLIFIVVCVLSLHAQAPRIFSYQGVLTDPTGAFIPDGNHSLTIRLYEQPSGGTAVYEESQSVAVIKGIFNAFIGSITPIPSSLAFDRAYFLGVSVDGGAELVPRTAMSAAPYALYAQTAGVANSLSPNVTGVVTSVNGKSGTVTLQGSGATTITNVGDTITINSTGGSGWGLSGNTATDPATNFIGTTDSTDLVFKVNNRERFRINAEGLLFTPSRGFKFSTYFGASAGRADTAGQSNTGFGDQALSQLVSGVSNTAFGNFALRDLTTGTRNTAIGYNVLTANNGDRNIGLGSGALQQNTTGSRNTALGNVSLTANLTGNDNTALGFFALGKHVTGDFNTAIGDSAMYSDSIGTNNTTLGAFSFFSNVAGSGATAIGYRAMANANNTKTPYANANTAVGYQALLGSSNPANNTGNQNTSVGYQTLMNTTSGYQNSAFGYEALKANTTGRGNTAIGVNSLPANTTGWENVAIGQWSLESNTTGRGNSALGYRSMHSNISGIENVAAGQESLESNVNGASNTAFGYQALKSNTSGSSNTGIGYQANVSAGNFSNATVMGYQANATASNQVRIGNTSITSIGGQVGWTTLSDERVKNNINDGVRGLDFIMKLHPVTYRYEITKINSLVGRKDLSDYPGKNDIEKMTFSGFLAQEVEQAAKSSGYDFSGVDLPKNEKDLYGIRYGDFVVPIVKAMQEQQKLITDQKATISQLQMSISLLEQRLRALEEGVPNVPVIE